MVMLFSQRIALTHHANTINTDEKNDDKKNVGNTDNVQRDGVCERLFQHYVAYRGQRRDVSWHARQRHND
jgi:hypothetical protein